MVQKEKLLKQKQFSNKQSAILWTKQKFAEKCYLLDVDLATLNLLVNSIMELLEKVGCDSRSLLIHITGFPAKIESMQVAYYSVNCYCRYFFCLTRLKYVKG